MVVELAESQVICDSIELNVLYIGQNRSGNRHGIYGRVIVLNAHILARLADKRGIKRRVVGDQNAITRKFEKSRNRLRL